MDSHFYFLFCSSFHNFSLTYGFEIDLTRPTGAKYKCNPSYGSDKYTAMKLFGDIVAFSIMGTTIPNISLYGSVDIVNIRTFTNVPIGNLLYGFLAILRSK